MCLEHGQWALTLSPPRERDSVSRSGVRPRVVLTLRERVAALAGVPVANMRVAAVDVADDLKLLLRKDAATEGIYQEVVARAPHLGSRIETFVAAHPAVRARANTLDRYARYRAPEAMVHVLLDQVGQDVVDRDERHVELLQDAWLTDIGGSG